MSVKPKPGEPDARLACAVETRQAPTTASAVRLAWLRRRLDAVYWVLAPNRGKA